MREAAELDGTFHLVSMDTIFLVGALVVSVCCTSYAVALRKVVSPMVFKLLKLFHTSTKYMSMDYLVGRKEIGKLYVSDKVIAETGNGSIIFEGVYGGHTPVAVKRFVKGTSHGLVLREIKNLIASHKHPNLVRLYAVECDRGYVYLAQERCPCSLYDLIMMCVDTPVNPKFKEEVRYKSISVSSNRETCLDFVKSFMGLQLWKPNGYPSPALTNLMRDVINGVVHLHNMGISHQNLRPQNVLITKNRYLPYLDRSVSLLVKISGTSVGQCFVRDESSLGHHATGYGPSEWLAPEQLLHGSQTSKGDIFSLGCVLFFCITGGQHPFIDSPEHDKNKLNLSFVKHIPEAVELFPRLLDQIPEQRPTAEEVVVHPLFWDSRKRLSFLEIVNRRIKSDDAGKTDCDILEKLENISKVVMGRRPWDEMMAPALFRYISSCGRYDFFSIRDLICFIVAVSDVYTILPPCIKVILGPTFLDMEDYFRIRFPKLVMELHKVMYIFCRDERDFQNFYRADKD